MVTSRANKPWRRVFGAAAAASVIAGLSLLPSCGSGFLDGISDGLGDATFDSSSSEAEGIDVAVDARTCNSELAPERPTGIDVPSSSDRRLLFAIEALRVDGEEGVGDAGVGPARGLDIDRTCTCPEPESCVRRVGEGRCDGPNGRDNAFGTFFTLLGLSLQDVPNSFATDRIRRGAFTILVEVLGWNGTPNDPSVVVTLRMSQQLDNPVPDAAVRDKPLFDGTDVWTVDPESVAQGGGVLGADCRDKNVICAARIRDDNAYVRDGHVVAHPKLDTGPNVPVVVRAGLGRFVIDLVETTIHGQLVPSGDSYRLEGEITGRWPERGALTAIANLEQLGKPDANVCQDDAGYATVKSIICKTLDLAGESARDGRGDRCTAASAALSFSAGKAAGVGHILRKDSLEPPCGDWTDDCSD